MDTIKGLATKVVAVLVHHNTGSISGLLSTGWRIFLITRCSISAAMNEGIEEFQPRMERSLWSVIGLVSTDTMHIRLSGRMAFSGS